MGSRGERSTRRRHRRRRASRTRAPRCGRLEANAWVVSLGLGVAACGAPGPVEPRAAPGELTLATYNVFFEAVDDADTVAAVGETGADVVLLQEVTARWQEVLEARYREPYPHRLFAPEGGAGGLGVLSRFPLRDLKHVPPLFKHPAWLVRVQAPWAELNVLNVHLRASRRAGQDIVSGLLSQSSDHELELRAFLDACDVLPEVVAGDFNDEPHEGGVAWLERRGFVDALERHHPGDPTFRVLGGLYSSTLDHILLDVGWSAADAWVLHRGNSDHWPLVARLRSARALR